MENATSSSSSSTVVPVKKPMLTPKAIIHQKFGTKACYTIEEVQEPSENECPGLALPQKGPSLFICHLHLPDFSVVSPPCKRKKEAEQSASEMALKKLGIDSQNSSPAILDAGDELVSRLSYIFASELLSSLHPLSSHLKAVFRREGELNGLVPVPVLIACDAKLGNLCKSFNPRVESNPFLSIPLVMRAAVKLSELLVISEEELWIRRKKPYPSDLMSSLNQQSHTTNGTCTEVVYIPFSLDKNVLSVSLDLCSRVYYLDIIAQELGVMDASKVLISRTIGKASSEMRLYFSAVETHNLNPVSEFHTAKGLSCFGCSFNVRASYLLGQPVYGDAILASIGYTWRGAELFTEDVTLRTYFRMLVGKTPDGLYKLSREAILVADLPTLFTTKANWRGSSPRDLLCVFCRQHRLSEPVFNVLCNNLESDQSSPASCNKPEAKRVMNENGDASAHGQNLAGIETFRCEIRVFSMNQDLILESFPKESFKKQVDAVQNASLKVLSWLNLYFKQLDMHLDKQSACGIGRDIQCHSTCFLRKFSLCQLIHNVLRQSDSRRGQKLNVKHTEMQNNMINHEDMHLIIGGPEYGSPPCNGSLACIRYSATLVPERKEELEIVESNDEFEFEVGTGAVIPSIETVVLQMTVGQSVCLYMNLPPQELVLAAAMDSQKVLSCLSSKACCLEFSMTLLRITEPCEDRVEQALFSPPLSKQRVEYALQCIKKISATSLIDFGCGSGSLLDSLMDTPSSLEKIVGIDISQKGLIRAAKILNSKLEKLETTKPTSGMKSAILYEGSITVFDPRLYGFDIGTCLEVIEHMEEDQACLFGNIALGLFRPKVLIVSTPNYEYNVILQGSNLATQEEDPDEKAQSQTCKFRNHDHKFEWTRQQFNRWASDLALRYHYEVEFGGVGGVPGVEPGFASQIAVFRRDHDQKQPLKDCAHFIEAEHQYKTTWEWSAAASATMNFA